MKAVNKYINPEKPVFFLSFLTHFSIAPIFLHVALFIFDIFGWGLIRGGGGLIQGGGAYTRRGAYEIIADINKTLIKDLVYFSRNFFMSI